MRALVADDETTSRMLLQHLLGSWGYDVVAAEDGKQAWQWLSSKDPPALAVLDWMMPGMDGIDICQRLRSEATDTYVYTILVTHRQEQNDLSQALDAGADDFVRKPLNPAELKSRLAVGQRVVTYETKIKRYARKMEELAESRAKQLVHADRMATLGLLSAGVAHEVNNPATFISGNAQTLKRFWKDVETVLAALPRQDEETQRKLAFITEEFPKALDGIHNGVKRIAGIVKGLKAYARQGNTPKAACAIEGCVERALDLCRYQLKNADVTIVCELDEHLPEVFADAQQIEQVLVNLMVNGSHAMDGRDNPVLRISGSSNGREVCVCIEDSGTGIPPQIMDQIWDPFFTTKSAGKGTGLGLAICKGIVEDHSGTISVENKFEGGARFRLTLPVLTPRSLAA